MLNDHGNVEIDLEQIQTNISAYFNETGVLKGRGTFSPEALLYKFIVPPMGHFHKFKIPSEGPTNVHSLKTDFPKWTLGPAKTKEIFHC